jgi:hypothetical protein
VAGEVDMSSDSILEEASRLVHGDRGGNYGHPFDDFTRTAAIVNPILAYKLKEPLIAEDVIKVLLAVKLSRETNLAAHDNRVDLAGYAEVLDMTIRERVRRETCDVATLDVHEMQFAAEDAGTAIPKDSSVTQN